MKLTSLPPIILGVFAIIILAVSSCSNSGGSETNTTKDSQLVQTDQATEIHVEEIKPTEKVYSWNVDPRHHHMDMVMEIKNSDKTSNIKIEADADYNGEDILTIRIQECYIASYCNSEEHEVNFGGIKFETHNGDITTTNPSQIKEILATLSKGDFSVIGKNLKDSSTFKFKIGKEGLGAVEAWKKISTK